MNIKFLQTGQSQLSYIKFGEGPQKMICFHGFGLDKSSFTIFEKRLGKFFTFYSFDLFWHGQSIWTETDKALEKSTFAKAIDSFFSEEKIERFSLLAFSMGGKSALVLTEFFAARIDKIVLVAPDGIETNFWYKAATYSSLLSTAFKSTIYNPGPYFSVIHILLSFRMADPGVLKFISNEMNTPQKRERVYYSWMVYRKFSFNINRIIALLNNYKIHTGFVTGQYDKIIETKMILKYEKKILHARHKVLNCGHTNLLKSLADDTDLLSIFGV